MTMDGKNPSTLLELSIQIVLCNELTTIHGLEEIPTELFVPLFNAAFKGGHKKILAAMVKTWPFFCLHIGKLSVQEPHSELLKAMVHGLQVLPSQNSPKLRILDLRQDTDCRITCPEISKKSPLCLHSCAYSEHSILTIEAQCNIVHSESDFQSSKKAMELLVDFSLNGTLRGREFISLLISKVKQSLGSLHLCCTLTFLDMACVDHLAVGQASLSEVTTLLSQIVQLNSLSLSKITFRSLNGKIFRTFLMHLGRMGHLKKFTLASFCTKNHLETLLRVLPPNLDFLYLSLCELSHRDFRFLSQSPQTKHLKLLNLSNNLIYWEDFEFLQTFLENLSGTLQHLEINHCLLTDATLSILLPTLTHCAQLRVLSFALNPITMPMLMRIMQHLTPLMDLKQKLSNVQVQLKTLLQVAGQDDMKWMTYSY
uniref:Melanoma antigen preferentially expressed in tumors-like n=1 Tax=Jaculus jaculus TaxID=51337 RepID=A0A8C5K2X6_JACJA